MKIVGAHNFKKAAINDRSSVINAKIFDHILRSNSTARTQPVLQMKFAASLLLIFL